MKKIIYGGAKKGKREVEETIRENAKLQGRQRVTQEYRGKNPLTKKGGGGAKWHKKTCNDALERGKGKRFYQILTVQNGGGYWGGRIANRSM